MIESSKRSDKMKKIKTNFASIIKKTVKNSLKRDANNTTCIAVYQPRVPVELNKFSKINKE